MFGFFKKNNKKKTDKSAGLNSKECVGNAGQSMTSDEIRAEALANMRAARENLGNETIQKIAESMKKMEQQSAAMKAAREKLAAEADAEVVASEILSMIETKH